jgi:hypothetical protein
MVELRTLFSTTSVMPPAIFVLVIYETGPQFTLRQAWPMIFLLKLPCIAGMTGICHRVQSLVEMGGLMNYLPGLATNFDPPDLSFPSS